MKNGFWLMAAIALVAVSAVLVVKQQDASYRRELQRLQQVWAAEKAELEAAIDEARARNNDAQPLAISTPAPRPTAPAPSAAEIIIRLKSLGGAGEGSGPHTREAIFWLEQLTRMGPAALPAIAEFLSSNEEVEYDTSWFQGRAAREGQLPRDQVAPISLRFALAEVARRIGGSDAESMLVSLLGGSARGAEVAWVNRILYELAGAAHREEALAVSRGLLARPAPANSPSALDRYHREYLFAVLEFYGDTGYASEARNQLVRADSQIDRGALRYLQQTLGAQSVPLAAETYRNPLLATNSAAKEPLARLALSFVGADASANEFWAQAINDPVLTKDHRRNLIEDLNEDGLDFRNLTAKDLPLIQARMALIEQLASTPLDKVNAEAFAEAYKDLANMQAKLAPR